MIRALRPGVNDDDLRGVATLGHCWPVHTRRAPDKPGDDRLRPGNRRTGRSRPGSERREDAEEIPQLDGGARFFANALRVGSLLAGAASFSVALEGTPVSVYSIVAGSGASLGAGVVTGTLASAIGNRFRERLRPIISPVAFMLRIGASLTGVSRMAAVVTGREPGAAASDEEVSAALRESLDRLETSRIPEGQEELRMIRGVLRMDSVKVREIMRPRVDMVAAAVNSDLEAITELMAVGGYSKIPVYKGSIDDVAGVIYARDLLRAREDENGNSASVQSLTRPAMFVPESQNLERLLQEFQERRTSIAIVVDEYGGVSGLVTVTDLIEEIVGELVDEFDVEEPEVQRISDSESLVDARASIDLLNEKLGTQIEAEGFDTVGGLVYRELGKMPANGDTIQVDGLVITVQSTIGRRIHRVRVGRAG